jgi:hypothetical protein
MVSPLRPLLARCSRRIGHHPSDEFLHGRATLRRRGGKQIFDPPGFSPSVCTSPWANPLQKLSRAAFPGLTGLAEQASARSPAVLMLRLTGGVLGGAATAGTAQVNAKMMIGRMSGP